jgi:O-antigen/teichoic acid export membrane protein
MSIRKNISYILISNLLITGINFISSVFTTRILGPIGRGDYTLYNSSLALGLLLLGFSISSTIPYFVNSNKINIGSLLKTLFIFNILSTALVVLILCMLKNFDRLNWVIPSNYQSNFLIIIFTLLYFIQLSNSVLLSVFNSLKRFGLVSIAGLLSAALPLGLVILIYFNKFSFLNLDKFSLIISVLLLGNVFSFIIFTTSLKKTDNVNFKSNLLPFSQLKAVISATVLSNMANILTFIAYKFDLWIVDSYHGKSILGVYSLASQIAMLLWIFSQSISNVLYSHASSVSENEGITLTLFLKKVGFYGTLVLAMILILIAKPVFVSVYGVAFEESAFLLKYFLIGIVLFTIPTILSSFFAAHGNFKFSLIISAISTTTSLAFYFMLIPKYGAIGGAIASSSSYLISTIVTEYFFCKTYNVSFTQSILPQRSDVTLLRTHISRFLKK